MSNIPHTAAPGASFNISRLNSATHRFPSFSEGDEYQVSQIQDISVNPHSSRAPQAPMTSATDGPRFAYQQSSLSAQNGSTLFNSAATQQAQAQAYQMQMMQMEIIRLQVCLISFPSVNRSSPIT
jgi:hypothetical protein